MIGDRILALSCWATLSTAFFAASAAEALELPRAPETSAGRVSLPSGPSSLRGLADDPVLDGFSGQVSYRLPIELPPGPAGFAPSLSLVYSGALGNGPLGIGWTIELPLIRRSLRHGVPTYTDSDELELSGVGAVGRLVSIGDDEYRIEGTGSAIRVKRTGARFEVTDPNGVRFILGMTADGREGEEPRTETWRVQRIVDLAGQVINFDYARSGGTLLPSEIVWGPGGRFRVTFEYQAREDVISSFRTGRETTTPERLSKVRVYSGGSELRAYHLAYDVSLSVSRLASVEMTGWGGGLSLPVVRFAYAARSAAAVAIAEGTDGWHLGARAVSFYDVDGDGADDLVRLEPGSHSYKKNLGGRFAPARGLGGGGTADGVHSAFVDVDGDARAELVRIVDDVWRVSAPSDDGWSAARTWEGSFAVPLAGVGWVLGDLDGDGRTDAVQGTGRGLLVRWGEPAGLSSPLSVPDIAADDPEVEPGARGVRALDWNGDGILDFAWLTDSWIKVFLGRGDGTFKVHARVFYPWGTGAFDLDRIFLADLDRDGIVDLLRVTAGHLLWFSGQGNGRFSDLPRQVRRPDAADADSIVALADANGNGSTDVVWSSPAGLWILDLAGPTSAGMLTEIDNGYGKRTLIEYDASALLAIRAWEAGQSWVHAIPSSIAVPVAVVQEIAGEPRRTELRGYRDAFWDGAERRFGGFLEALQSSVGTSGESTLLVRTRFHAGLGDSRVLRGKAWWTRTESGTGRLLSLQTTEWVAHPIDGLTGGPLLRRPAVVASELQLSEGGPVPIITRTTYVLDGEGRPEEEHSEGRVDLAGDERSTVRTFASSDATWVRDRVCEETVSGGGSVLSRTRHYFGSDTTLEGLCVVGRGWARKSEAELVETSGSRWITTSAAEYDALGNQIEVFDGAITRAIDFDADGLYPIAETQDPGTGSTLKWQVEWDAVGGVPVHAVDPNGNEWHAAYDALLRVSAISGGAEAPHVRYAYDWSTDHPSTTIYEFDGLHGTEPSSFTGWDQAASWRQSVDIFNGAGEKLYRATRLASSEWLVSSFLLRDERGLVSQLSDGFRWMAESPMGAVPPVGTPFQSISRDALGRPIEHVLPTGARATSRYEPYRKIATSDGLSSVTTISDGLGRLVRTERTVDGVLEYAEATYDALDRLLQVELQGGLAVHEFEYDTLGRLVGTTASDMGSRVLEYDDRSRLVAHTNGKGERVEIQYDELGRPVRVDDVSSGGFLSYVYDDPAVPNSKGRLSSVVEELSPSAESLLELAYDEFGRPTKSARTINGVYGAEDRQFTSSGLLVSVSYDDDFAYERAFDKAGRLKELGGLWTATQRDGAGRILVEEFGSGVLGTVERDDLGLPARLTVEQSSGTKLSDVEVTRTPFGAVASVVDLLVGGLDQSAAYTYDGGARLRTATLGSVPNAFAFEYQYDALQNMTSRTASGPRAVGLPSGQYVHGSSGFGPRQLAEVVRALPAGSPAAGTWRIDAVAGGGSDPADGSIPAYALLKGPDGLGVDKLGGVIWAEKTGNKVRRTDLQPRVLRVAGTGTAGNAGNDGPALAALLSAAEGVSVANDGRTLFVADTGNHQIRRIDRDGVISVVAGNGTKGFSGDNGAATSATLRYPSRVLESADGSLLIADTGNHRIRKVSPDGIITTIAGNGSTVLGGDGGLATAAGLSSPVGLSLGSDGSLYIADVQHDRVRRVSTAGIITTVAGTTRGYFGDGGAAISAKLNLPRDVAVAADGAIWIADTANHRVRRVDPSGQIATIAGEGVASSTGDGGAASNALVHSPSGLVIGPDGTVFVSGGDRVRKLSLVPSNPQYAYDDVGRLVEDDGVDLAYNAIDQLMSATLPARGPAAGWSAGAATVEYAYGSSGQRIYAQRPGSTEFTFTDGYSERNGVREHYIYVDERLVAKVTRVPAGSAALGGQLDSAGPPLDFATTVQVLAVVLAGILAVALRRKIASPSPAWVGRTSLVVLAALLAQSCGIPAAGTQWRQSIPRALWTDGTTTYFHPGFAAGPALETAQDESIVEERRYEPFGAPIDAFVPSATRTVDFEREPFNVLNKETDPTSGLSFHGARWMSPGLARWISPDPAVSDPNAEMLGTFWALHPYAYASQNPTLFWDPDGRFAITIEAAAVAAGILIVGAVVWHYNSDEIKDWGSDVIAENAVDGVEAVAGMLPHKTSEPGQRADVYGDFAENEKAMLEGGGARTKEAASTGIDIAGTVVSEKGIGRAARLAKLATKPAREAIAKVVGKFHKHHPWPMYLGGPRKQDLEKLPTELHVAYHRGLDVVLPRKASKEFYDSLSPAQRVEMRRELANYTKEFDRDNGTNLYDAMIRNGFDESDL